MSRYLPYGKELIPTEEQIEQQQIKFKRYNYYGVPYGEFDGNDYGEGRLSQKDKDIEQARILIMAGKEIPKDLENRLLEYKKKNKYVKKDIP